MNAWQRLAEEEPALFAELRALDVAQRRKAAESLQGELPSLRRKVALASLAIDALKEEA